MLSLPDGKTKTVSISQEPQQRYWFGICPVSSKIGNLKMCGGCKTVGYIGKEEQKEHWPEHKKLCKILCTYVRGKGLSSDKVLAVLREKLGRPLTQYEMDIAHFPRVCMVCESDDFDSLKNCKGVCTTNSRLGQFFWYGRQVTKVTLDYIVGGRGEPSALLSR